MNSDEQKPKLGNLGQECGLQRMELWEGPRSSGDTWGWEAVFDMNYNDELSI